MDNIPHTFYTDEWIIKHINSLYNVYYITATDYNKGNEIIKRLLSEYYSFKQLMDDEELKNSSRRKYYIITDYEDIKRRHETEPEPIPPNIKHVKHTKPTNDNFNVDDWINNNAVVDEVKHIKYILSETINKLDKQHKNNVVDYLKTNWTATTHLTAKRSKRGYFIKLDKPDTLTTLTLFSY